MACYSRIMSGKRPYGLQAPGAAAPSRSYEMPGRAARRGAGRPGVDEHHPSIRPEISRNELIDGRVVHASPSRFPHGSRNFDLDYLVGAHLAAGYRGATDLVTRFDRDNDFASDTAILKEGLDPETGERHLEEIAFEVVSEQGEKIASTKAARMSRRGVRRIFGIFVKKGEVREWVKRRGTAGWVKLEPDAEIEDPCLDVPLEVGAILDAARRDNVVARALIAKDNPAILEHASRAEARGRAEGEARGRAEGEARGRAEGEARGRAISILTILEQRGLEPSAELRRRILECTDLQTLDRWLAKALVAEAADEVIGTE